MSKHNSKSQWLAQDSGLDARMEATSRMAREFSHSLSTPLSVILSNSERLVSRLQDRPELLPYLEDILAVSRSSATLMQRISELSRSHPSVQTTVEVHGLLHSLIEPLKIDPGNLEITLRLEADLDKVLGDPQALMEALRAVLDNSLEAMSGSGTLDIESCTLDSQAVPALEGRPPLPWLKITVADSGPGMDPKLISKIFDPFFTTRENKKNSGLGLAHAYGIIRSHGGRIGLQSTLGAGVTVEFLLPLVIST
jgi:two-component system, cell cycle sensor histidine kinase and response regulator CckA